MDIPANTDTATRTIAGFSVNVPQPYNAGEPLTEITAAMLNQTFAENISNNMRKTLNAGLVAEEGQEAQPYTDATAQTAIDKYVAEYEPGVRRGGSGEARITDPVEREARKLAKKAVTDLIKSQGGKTAHFEVDELTETVFNGNRETLMSQAKKIIDQLKKASSGISLEGISVTATTAA